ncbi:MAG: hypothetical protein U0176_20445 [Bacteroidia bacterium]
MAFGKNKTLRVEFYEAKNGSIVGYDEMRLKDVPEDFEAETWVEIDGDRWKVVGVEPSKPKKALKSGTLVVHVELVKRKEATKVEEAKAAPVVEAVKEATVFVSPSRADQLPRMSGKREDLRLLEMATWEWRNIELTLAANRGTVLEVFGKIKELVSLNSTERDGRTFYTRQYERYDMFAPLRGTKLKLEQIIMDYYPAAVAVDGLTFMGSDQVANSTFVFMVGSGTVFYGQEFDEVVRYLALHRPDQLKVEDLRADAEVLARLMKKKELILVDWTLRQIVEPQGRMHCWIICSLVLPRMPLRSRSRVDGQVVHRPCGGHCSARGCSQASKAEEVPAVVPVVVETVVTATCGPDCSENAVEKQAVAEVPVMNLQSQQKRQLQKFPRRRRLLLRKRELRKFPRRKRLLQGNANCRFSDCSASSRVPSMEVVQRHQIAYPDEPVVALSSLPLTSPVQTSSESRMWEGKPSFIPPSPNCLRQK